MRLLTQEFLIEASKAQAVIYDSFIAKYGEDWTKEQEAELLEATRANTAEWKLKAEQLLDEIYGPAQQVTEGESHPE